MFAAMKPAAYSQWYYRRVIVSHQDEWSATKQ